MENVKPDCVRLAAMGGPEKSSLRGMTLQMETDWLSHVFNRVFDLELLIASQETVLNRAKRVYNAKEVAAQELILSKLMAMRSFDEKQKRQEILALMFE